MKSNQTIEIPLETYNELLEIEKKYLLLKKDCIKSDCSLEVAQLLRAEGQWGIDKAIRMLES